MPLTPCWRSACPALKIISLSFILAGFGIACSSLFQAMGHGMLSLWVSVLRQLVILLPAAFLFAKTLGLSYVWFAFPLAEVFFRRDQRRIPAPCLQKGDPSAETVPQPGEIRYKRKKLPSGTMIHGHREGSFFVLFFLKGISQAFKHHIIAVVPII